MKKAKRRCYTSIWHKAVVALMTLAVLIMIVPMSVYAGEVSTGTMGDNGGFTWTYDAETQILTITGEDSGLEGVFNRDTHDTESAFLNICEGTIKHIVLENCKISGSASNMFAFLSEVESITFKNVDTSNVTSMERMFKYCEKLQSLNLGGINTSNVTNMESMFEYCSSLQSLDLSGFDTSKVTTMAYMFQACSELENLDLGDMNTFSVKDMSNMFCACSKLKSLDVSKFDTSKVTSFAALFANCSSLTELDVSGFDTSNVTDMNAVFDDCSSLKNLDVSGWNTSKVTLMPSLFSGCSSLTYVDVSKFDTSSVYQMNHMFAGCSGLTSLDVSGFDTSNVVVMMEMFYGCSGLTSLDVSGFDTSNVNTTSGMFSGCSSLESIDVSGFNTSKVTNFGAMFTKCSSLSELDLSGFDTRAAQTLGGMFSGCSNLKRLDISGFDTTDVIYFGDFFKECTKLEWIKTPKAMDDNQKLQLPYEFYDENQRCTTSITSDFCDAVLTSVKEEEINPFADVKENSWQYTFAKFAMDNNLMTGKGKDEKGNIKFDPNSNMTRAEFVQTLYNKEGKPQVTYVERFKDVRSKDWFASAIIWASDSNNNIVAGKNDKFDVSGNVTRQEIAVILYKYAKYLNCDVTGNVDLEPYADDEKIASWAGKAMKWAISNGIMKGKGSGDDISTYKLDPTGDATRAECAAMLKNFMDAYEK